MVAVFCEDCDQVAVFFLRTAVMIAVFSEDCDYGHSLFLRTANIFSVLITLKIYDFFRTATILKRQLRESLSAGG